MADAEYPGTLAQFDRWFATEDACRKSLATLRWPAGFRCPGCKSTDAWLTERSLMHCKGCGRQVSVTAGTLFHGTRSSLRLWLQAMWWVTAQKNGASALGLQRILGLGSVLDASAASLLPFVRSVAAPGSKIITDGWKGYGTLLWPSTTGPAGQRAEPRRATAARPQSGLAAQALAPRNPPRRDRAHAPSLLPR
jgi:hypothetical protein